MAQTFTKNERLCSIKEINALVKDGQVLFHYPFRVTYLVKENDIPEAGSLQKSNNKLLISVPKRNFKRAVRRNLLKRRVRESYRKNKEILQLPDNTGVNLLLVYVSKDILEYSYIESKIRDILGKISKAVTQNS